MIEADGTENKSNLGANAILACSLACAHAAARASFLPLFRYIGGVGANRLPVPMMNIINGGRHADNPIDIQEFMIVPVGFDSFHEGLRAGVEVFHSLKSVLSEKKLSTSVGDEGGFAPDLKSTPEAIELILKAIEKAKYTPGEQVKLALDAASTEFYDAKAKKYTLEGKEARLRRHGRVSFGTRRQVPHLLDRGRLCRGRLGGLEAAHRRAGGASASSSATTYSSPTSNGCRRGSTRGSPTASSSRSTRSARLTETIDAVQLASRFGYTSVISHRSGETEDTTIADLAVASARARSRPGRPAAPTASASTTSCCGSKRFSARRPVTAERL